jgi:hypothetical protein
MSMSCLVSNVAKELMLSLVYMAADVRAILPLRAYCRFYSSLVPAHQGIISRLIIFWSRYAVFCKP